MMDAVSNMAEVFENTLALYVDRLMWHYFLFCLTLTLHMFFTLSPCWKLHPSHCHMLTSARHEMVGFPKL
jgi:hypothetical protein